MVRVGSLAFVSAWALGAAALAQTPGEIADPGSYRGSMALQAQEQAQSAQIQQQNQAMLNRLDQNYAAYAPRGGGGRSGAPPLQQKPLLPATKNPLLTGMWRMGPTRRANLGSALGALPGAQGQANDMMSAGCSVFLADPNEVIRFTPTSIVKVSPGGREELVERVEYRGDQGNVIALPQGTLIPVPLIIGLTNPDHAVVALFGCTMSRTNTSAAVAAAPPPSGTAGPGGAQARATAAPPGGAGVGKAVLKLTVGERVDGRLSSPPAGTRIILSTQNPDANLTKAGFGPDNPVENLFAACKIGQGGVQQRCSEGVTALGAGAIGVMTTDPNGQAATGEIAPGRYYIVAFTPYKGHSLIWHLPIDLKPGENRMDLTPQAGSVSH